MSTHNIGHLNCPAVVNDEKLAPNSISAEKPKEPQSMQNVFVQKLIESPVEEMIMDVVDVNPFRCQQCPEVFESSEMMEIHHKIHVGGRRFETDVDLLSPIKHSKKARIEIETEIEIVDQLQDFPSTTVSSTYSESNSETQNSFGFQCSCCDKMYDEIDALEAHLKYHPTVPKKFACQICNEKFTGQAKLRLHLKEEHYAEKSDQESSEMEVTTEPEESSKQYACEECNMNFLDPTALQNHKVECHTEIPSFQCNICNRFFTTLAFLEVHMVAHEQLGKSNVFPCIMCDKFFASEEYYNDHVEQNHTFPTSAAQTTNSNGKAKIYTCKTCDKSFQGKAQLKKHSIIHKNGPQDCCFCEKSFPDTDALDFHVARMHAEYYMDFKFDFKKKEHCCQICGKKFKNKWILGNHALVHEDTFAFKCEICQKSFKRKGALKTHTNSMHRNGSNVSQTITESTNKSQDCLVVSEEQEFNSFEESIYTDDQLTGEDFGNHLAVQPGEFELLDAKENIHGSQTQFEDMKLSFGIKDCRVVLQRID